MRVRDEQMAALRKDITARSLVERLSSSNGRAQYDHTTYTIHSQDAVGRRKQIRLGNSGFVEEIRTATGRATRFLNDADGRILGVQESSGQQTTFGYGPDSQLRSIARDGKQICEIQLDAERTFSNLTFWDGSTLRSHYTPSSKPLQIKDRLGGVNVFNYDDDEFLTEFINARGESTHFEFNTEGLPANTIHADGRRESVLAYDGTGNPIEVANNGQSTFTASYSARNCPTAVNYSDGSEYKFVRDDKNRIVEAIGPGAHTKFSYDEQGLPIEETTNGETFRMEYDASGLLTSLEYPDGTRASFGYDEDKRLTGYSDWTGRTTHFAYDGDRAVTIRTPNRLTQQVSLRQNGKPERIRLSEEAQGRVVADTHFEYDIQQRLTMRSEVGGEQHHYVYDAESQLTGMYVGQRWLENYYYDPAGNRVASHLGPAVVDSGNRLTRQGADTYEYDARGNIIASTTDDQPWTFEYDLRNQMVAANGPSGTVRFEYDALGRRISKSTDARHVRYLWCGEQITRERITTAQGVETRDYLYQPSTYKALAMRIGSECYFFHTNHASTPDRISDASGQIVWSASYESFGRAQIDVALIDNPLRFHGQYYDDETGLHYNRFRYYSPRLGRYWSVDPIGLVGGHNLYTYVGNDPVNRTDPLGLWWEVAVSALAAAAVAAVVVLTAPVSLPLLAVGALAVAAGVGVGLGVHEGITEYERSGRVCVTCILKGVGEGIVGGVVAIGLVAGAAAIAPELGAVALGLVIGYGLYSFGNMLFNWDNMTHEQRMEAVGGVIGGTIVGLVGGGWFGRGGGAPVEEPGSKLGESETKGGTEETPQQRYSRLKAERLEQQRQQALRDQMADADKKGKLGEIDDPADQEFLNDPKNKELAYDPDTKSYKPDEARTARQAEDDGTLKGPVRRAMPGVNPDEAGADYVDGDNNQWDVKDASHGADNIAETAKNGENVLVDGRNLSPAERAQLQNDINQRLANDPNAGNVKVVGDAPAAPAKAPPSSIGPVPPVIPSPDDRKDTDNPDE